MKVCGEIIEENLESLESSVKVLKKQFEQICEEWNDIEVAISDLNHFQEFLEFTRKGVIWLEHERTKLFAERRKYKKLYQRIVPHIKLLGELNKSLDDAAKPFAQTLYGVRSIRGYNLFHELPNYVKDNTQQFADLTSKGTMVNHIFSPLNAEADLFERQPLSVEKQKIVPKNIIIPPSVAMTEHQSFANSEQRANWAKFRELPTETPEERAARVEHELQMSLKIGSKKSRG